MTAALEGGKWSAARPGRILPPGKTRYPLYRGLGGPQGQSGRAENLVLTGIRSRTVQPVAQSLYRLSYRPALKIEEEKYRLMLCTYTMDMSLYYFYKSLLLQAKIFVATLKITDIVMFKLINYFKCVLLNTDHTGPCQDDNEIRILFYD